MGDKGRGSGGFRYLEIVWMIWENLSIFMELAKKESNLLDGLLVGTGVELPTCCMAPELHMPLTANPTYGLVVCNNS